MVKFTPQEHFLTFTESVHAFSAPQVLQTTETEVLVSRFSDNLNALSKSIKKPKKVEFKSFKIQKSSSLASSIDSHFNSTEMSVKSPRELQHQLVEIRKSNSCLLNQEITTVDRDSEKYYKKFDFFYRRTAFRSMTEFYKGLFKPILDRWREGERKSTKNFVQQFICKNANLVGFKMNQDIRKLHSFMNNDSSAEFHIFQAALGDKMNQSLKHTFAKYDNEDLATTGQGPISDNDKQTLKYNLRKQDLFE